MLRGTGAFRRLAMIWPQTWWGLPVGWARWGVQRRKRTHLCSVSAAGAPPPCTERTTAASQAGRKPRRPGAWGPWKGPRFVHDGLESACLRAWLLPGHPDGWSE